MRQALVLLLRLRQYRYAGFGGYSRWYRQQAAQGYSARGAGPGRDNHAVNIGQALTPDNGTMVRITRLAGMNKCCRPDTLDVPHHIVLGVNYPDRPCCRPG